MIPIMSLSGCHQPSLSQDDLDRITRNRVAGIVAYSFFDKNYQYHALVCSMRGEVELYTTREYARADGRYELVVDKEQSLFSSRIMPLKLHCEAAPYRKNTAPHPPHTGNGGTL